MELSCTGYSPSRHGALLVGVGSPTSNCVRFDRRQSRRSPRLTCSLQPESATGGLPRPVGWHIFIRCVGDVWFCWACGGLLLVRCVLTWWWSCPPSSCHTWTPSALFCVAGLRLVGTALAGSSVPRFRGRQEFVMGSLQAHEGSTTFPWVASRTVLLVYDLSGLRGPVVTV